MTDNEIIKALEHCASTADCDGCSSVLTNVPCVANDIQTIVGLINHQKAEVERLENSLAISKKETKRYAARCQTIRSDVAKEIAEGLHKYINEFRERREMVMLPYTEAALLAIERKIDNLVKEFTEETK